MSLNIKSRIKNDKDFVVRNGKYHFSGIITITENGIETIDEAIFTEMQ